jgi:hypothetical protein
MRKRDYALQARRVMDVPQLPSGMDLDHSHLWRPRTDRIARGAGAPGVPFPTPANWPAGLSSLRALIASGLRLLPPAKIPRPTFVSLEKSYSGWRSSSNVEAFFIKCSFSRLELAGAYDAAPAEADSVGYNQETTGLRSADG